MSLRKTGNKIPNASGTNPQYSAGNTPRGVSNGKGGTTSIKVGNSAGMKEQFSRKGVKS